MKIRFFGFEIELRKETEEEAKRRFMQKFNAQWGIPEQKPEQKEAK